jgi:hypothetical protein
MYVRFSANLYGYYVPGVVRPLRQSGMHSQVSVRCSIGGVVCAALVLEQVWDVCTRPTAEAGQAPWCFVSFCGCGNVVWMRINNEPVSVCGWAATWHVPAF